MIDVGYGDSRQRLVVGKKEFLGGRGMHYFLCKGRGIRLNLGKPDDNGRTCYQVVIEGQACEAHGVHECIRLAEAWLRSLGVVSIESRQVSRLDVAFNLLGVSMADVAALHPCRVTRCTKGKPVTYWNPAGDRWESQTYGKRGSDCHLRIYNKLVEMQEQAEKGHVEKFQVFREKYFPTGELQPFTRFEFEAKADLLKRVLGTNDLAAVLAGVPQVATYLTHEWFRYADRPVDRQNRNQSRLSTHPLWKAVQEVAKRGLPAEAPPSPKKGPQERQASLSIRTKRTAAGLKSQVVGILQSNPESSVLDAIAEALETAGQNLLSRYPADQLRAIAERQASEAILKFDETGELVRSPLLEARDLLLRLLERLPPGSGYEAQEGVPF